MAQRTTVRTTYDIERTLQPIYSGGSISLSEDGRIVAACLGEDALLTDITNGEELGRIEGDGEPITALILTPSAEHLIVCSRSTSMHIYSSSPSDTEDGNIEFELLRSLRPHTSPVVTLAVDKTGTLLATGGADGIVKVWDIRAGYTTHTFHGRGGVVSALHFFQVEVATKDGTNESSKKRKRISQQENAPEAIKGETTLEYRLASGVEDGKIHIWDLHTRKSAAILDSHVSVVRSLDFSPDQNTLVSGSRDKTLIIWDAQKWKAKRTIAVLETLESAGFVAGGHIAYSGGENGRIRLWSTETSQELTREQEPGIETDAIVEILHYPDLPYLISVHADQVLNFHSLVSVESPLVEEIIDPLPVFRRVSGTHDEVIDLAYIGSGKSLLALNTNSEDIRIVTLEEEGSNETPEGKYIGADVALLKGHEDLIISLDVDWSGHWLATGSKDNTARLWRIDPENDSYTCAAVLTGHAESLGAIALPHATPPESSAAYTDPLNNPPAYIITGSQDRTVKRWDTSKDMKQKLRAKYTRKAHDKDINAVDIDPSSALFASASQDRTVKIYSAADGEAVGVLRGHRRGVWTVKFQPKESQAPGSGGKGLIATGSADKTVKVWSLADYSCLLTLEGHSNSVLKLAWLPYRPVDARDKRGSQVASAAGDGLVKIWDSASGEGMSTLDNHTDRVWALTAHPSTGALISGGADSVITFWRDTTSTTLEAATTAETERVELDQKLQNYAFAGNYREAITLALQMDQPGRLFTLFKSVVESDVPDEGSLTGLTAVDDVVANLADEQLYKLLLRLRDWNTNVRSAPVAQKILWAVVKSYPASRLAGLKPAGKVGAKGSLKDVLDAIKAYSERHYKRVEELVDESYLLDFTLREMDEVGDVKSVTNGTAQLGLGGDVVMVE
ncbi:U3 small nucleolar RNA-associated protein 13 [Didymosphaeria variabile]|uniref:U3 small nucleolar RNA-associated protein 13 n=1 Tax=Didymosphaeria variabile TaxID=1932322 RepID=A0A9W8X9I0_9PLEO|nr:U3 small nucleolar RNA-associated protein 13 [Didymosphaeria variabile]KAJ4344646.1 U3 small nucleolar RNA-associated protein 13 [Didymosphaeria variabile]